MEEKRTHLIERAVARLGKGELADPVGLRPVAPDAPPVTNPSDNGGALGYSNGRSLLIDEAALVTGGLVDCDQRESRVSEEFRIVQNELLQQNIVGEVGKNIILITSALQGEGKSFTALNLSAGLARHGQRRVLLVDADFKAGALGHMLVPPETPGLLDLASGSSTDVSRFTLHTAIGNLDFIPVGKNTDRDSELLSSKRMGDVVQSIGQRYSDRLIIIDGPPCLMSSAPNTLAAVVGRVVLVVEANTTQEGDVNAALELCHSCPNISLVLNKIPTWSGHSFGSYYG